MSSSSRARSLARQRPSHVGVISRSTQTLATSRPASKMILLGGGGEDLSQRCAAQGAASVWYYRAERGRYADDLLKAAERAQANQRGAWLACDAELTPESPFDPRHKASDGGNGDGNGCHPSYEGVV